MERNEFALAGAMLLIVCCTLVISLALAGAGLRDQQVWAAWAQAVGTVGAIVTAIIMSWRERIKVIEREQRLASIRVAACLRSWLTPCASRVADVQNYESSQFHAGSSNTEIPPFDLNMADVASMEIANAKVVYSIVEQRIRAVETIKGAYEFADQDDAIREFYKESAKLFRRVRKMYRQLALESDLHPYTVQNWELDVINKAAEIGHVKNWEVQ